MSSSRWSASRRLGRPLGIRSSPGRSFASDFYGTVLPFLLMASRPSGKGFANWAIMDGRNIVIEYRWANGSPGAYA